MVVIANSLMSDRSKPAQQASQTKTSSKIASAKTLFTTGLACFTLGFEGSHALAASKVGRADNMNPRPELPGSIRSLVLSSTNYTSEIFSGSTIQFTNATPLSNSIPSLPMSYGVFTNFYHGVASTYGGTNRAFPNVTLPTPAINAGALAVRTEQFLASTKEARIGIRELETARTLYDQFQRVKDVHGHISTPSSIALWGAAYLEQLRRFEVYRNAYFDSATSSSNLLSYANPKSRPDEHYYEMRIAEVKQHPPTVMTTNLLSEGNSKEELRTPLNQSHVFPDLALAVRMKRAQVRSELKVDRLATNSISFSIQQKLFVDYLVSGATNISQNIWGTRELLRYNTDNPETRANAAWWYAFAERNDRHAALRAGVKHFDSEYLQVLDIAGWPSLRDFAQHWNTGRYYQTPKYGESFVVGGSTNMYQAPSATNTLAHFFDREVTFVSKSEQSRLIAKQAKVAATDACAKEEAQLLKAFARDPKTLHHLERLAMLREAARYTLDTAWVTSKNRSIDFERLFAQSQTVELLRQPEANPASVAKLLKAGLDDISAAQRFVREFNDGSSQGEYIAKAEPYPGFFAQARALESTILDSRVGYYTLQGKFQTLERADVGKKESAITSAWSTTPLLPPQYLTSRKIPASYFEDTLHVRSDMYRLLSDVPPKFHWTGAPLESPWLLGTNVLNITSIAPQTTLRVPYLGQAAEFAHGIGGLTLELAQPLNPNLIRVITAETRLQEKIRAELKREWPSTELRKRLVDRTWSQSNHEDKVRGLALSYRDVVLKAEVAELVAALQALPAEALQLRIRLSTLPPFHQTQEISLSLLAPTWLNAHQDISKNKELGAYLAVLINECSWEEFAFGDRCLRSGFLFESAAPDSSMPGSGRASNPKFAFHVTSDSRIRPLRILQSNWSLDGTVLDFTSLAKAVQDNNKERLPVTIHAELSREIARWAKRSKVKDINPADLISLDEIRELPGLSIDEQVICLERLVAMRLQARGALRQPLSDEMLTALKLHIHDYLDLQMRKFADKL